jgi:hypothetical protein
MLIHDCFAADYSDARTRFLAAAKDARARITSYQHPLRGPRNEKLFTDVARVGPDKAARLFVTMSATHGVEGFCGSGCQVATFGAFAPGDLPADTALVQIHAINPHGFAWLRRVTEDNVDLNRNFVPHGSVPYPVNAGYEELASAIAPAEWTGPVRQAADARLLSYGQQNGLAKLQWALTGGQYSHPHGIFFGGHAPTWSNRTLTAIVREHLEDARSIGFLDYHTGLGPYGVGEVIAALPLASPGAGRTRAILGAEVTSPDDGTSSSAQLTGVNQPAIEAMLDGTAFFGCALEYGTSPVPDVLNALRADAWLHTHGDLDSPEAKAIKAEVRRAFYPDADDWRRMVWSRAEDVTRRALAGVAQA